MYVFKTGKMPALIFYFCCYANETDLYSLSALKTLLVFMFMYT